MAKKKDGLDSVKIKTLNDLYYSPENPASFSSIDRLFDEAQKLVPDIKRSEVEEWTKSQLTYTLHKSVRKNFIRNRIIVSSIDEQWEADLVEMQEFSRQNQSYRYILTVIDCFSKYAWAVPIKNKTAKLVTSAFESILAERTPAALRTDKGKEFINSGFSKLLENHCIRYYSSSNRDIKCAIVERFNRTLKAKMFKYFTSKGTRKYVDVINKLLKSYNNAYHRAIKMPPIKVNQSNSSQVFQNLYGKSCLRDVYRSNKKIPRLEEADQVRVKYKQKPFDKGFYPNWSDQIYNISSIDKVQLLPVYTLNSEIGEKVVDKKFYDKEVQHVKADEHRVEKVLKRRVYKGKIQYFVKWLGYSTTHNSWINSDDLKSLG